MLLLLACADPGAEPDAGRDGSDAAIEPDTSGFPDRLGAAFDLGGQRVRFRVASRRATRIEVWVYAEPFGASERVRLELSREPGADVWSGIVDVTAIDLATVYYGYRAWGPNWPWDPAWQPGSVAGFVVDVDAEGNRFNPNKLLIDPHARELSHDPWHPDNLDGAAFRTGDGDRTRDSGPVAPKGIALAPVSPIAGPRPIRALADDVIYEVHVRGLTRNDPTVPEACRGTYAGVAAKADYLASIGVTAVELLPVHETPNDANDVAEGTAGDNYWGYSSLSWFAPDRRYACDRSPGGPTREFRAMVDALHARDLKVFVDVVYNHTAEGGAGGDAGERTLLLSWRGLDNAAYYQLADDARRFHDNTGIGASTNAADPMLRELVVDSLRYWSRDMGVDGFRFDLAAVLGNSCTRGCFAFDPDDPAGILQRAVTELPARGVAGGGGVDLIAEPWGIGAGTYQLGRFPPGWAEWNDRFRDAIRKDQNRLDVDVVTTGWLAARLAGSPDVGGDRGPPASINYVASHDGFTLRDVYACNAKRNDQPWPYGPSSGGDDNNHSWDHGGDPSRQRQAARTGLALVALATGVPMITGGDELYRTQYCNNNPYNLDSDKNWLDWSGVVDDASFHRFAGRMLRFRGAHPALRRTRHHTADSVSWHVAGGAIADAGYLDDPDAQFLGMRIDGPGTGDPAAAIYVAYNGGNTGVQIALPAPGSERSWYRVADTAAWAESFDNAHEPGAEVRIADGIYDVHARSLVVFVEQ